jgi:transposase
MVVMDFFLNLKPDLNPIENLWEHLKRGKVKHNPTSKDNNLWDVVNQ